MGYPFKTQSVADYHRQIERIRDPRGAARNEQDSQQKQDRHNRGASYRRPDLGNRYFRSMWEANYARFLNYRIERNMGVIGWIYEPIEFEFPLKRGNRTYRPDFMVFLSSGQYEWHEVKGWMDAASKTKLNRFAIYFPTENSRLVLVTGHDMKQIAQFSSVIPNWETKENTLLICGRE